VAEAVETRRSDLDRPLVRLQLRGISLPERYRGAWGDASRHVG